LYAEAEEDQEALVVAEAVSGVAMMNTIMGLEVAMGMVAEDWDLAGHHHVDVADLEGEFLILPSFSCPHWLFIYWCGLWIAHLIHVCGFVFLCYKRKVA